MKSTRLLKPSPQSVCLICLHHAQSRASPLLLRRVQCRRITSTRSSQKPPAEALAQKDDDSYERPAPPRKWGQFASTANGNSVDSFPDPDIQPLASFGNFGKQARGLGDSFPDPDLQNNVERTTTPRPSVSQPSPRWDEPASSTPNNLIRRTNMDRNGSDYERQSDRGVGWRGRPRYDSVSSRNRNDRGEEVEKAVPGGRGWGRHLRPRTPQEQAGVPAATAEPRGFESPSQTPPRSRPIFRRMGMERTEREESGELRRRRPASSETQFVGFRSVINTDREDSTSVDSVAEPSATTSRSLPMHDNRRVEKTTLEEFSTQREGSREGAESKVEPVNVIEDRFRSRGFKDNKAGKFDEFAEPRSFNATPKRRGKAEVEGRREQKFNLSQHEAEDFEDNETKARKERKKKRQQEKLARQAAPTVQTMELPPFISVMNLATSLRVRIDDFVRKLEELGFEDVANDHVLNFENASLIAMEYNYEATIDRSEVEDLKARPPVEDTSLLPPRPPIVTIMGHVDHGKTTLLDYLRKSSVAASEHGGITQHIGAFSVPMASGKIVTFLDTPGHAAFLSMRQRGANVTDIVVLVVAADDSVKPQTIEAIKHAKSARVPIIVAINKVDKDEADVQRVKQDLLRHEIEVEDFGGDVQAIPVSGKTGQGLDELEEALVAQAETIDMRAEIDGAVEGWVLEATTKAAGRVATVLVRRGTLRNGDVIVAGTTWARVRTLKNEAGIQVHEAGPGTPVEVDGWRDQPMAGDEVLQAPTEQKATSAVRFREARREREQSAKDMEAINESRRLETERREREKAEKEAAAHAPKNSSEAGAEADKVVPAQSNLQATATKEAAHKILYILIKADVSGSAEAIENSLMALPLDKHPVSLSILRTGVGPISESDVDHVAAVPAGHGILVSFNQPMSTNMAHQAEKAGIKIMDENIIYKVIDNVRSAVEDHLAPLVTKRVTGEAEAAQVFDINVGGRKTSKIVGCKVRNGIMAKGKKVRVYRGGMDDASMVYEGTINSLKSQKKDVAEMRKGTECGMAFEKWEDFQVGDLIQCYEEKSEKRRLL